MVKCHAALLDAVGVARHCGGGTGGDGALGALHAALRPSLNYSSGQLFSALAARAAHPQYARAAAAEGDAAAAPLGKPLGVVVVGAGPIGLRTAIELALCGHAVRVLESRGAFTRLNVLHLWEWLTPSLTVVNPLPHSGVPPPP